MWYHPVGENPVDRARRAWEQAGADWLCKPADPARAEAERRARARYEAALEAAGLTPLWAAGPDRAPSEPRHRRPARTH